jgi:hypothetical protein
MPKVGERSGRWGLFDETFAEDNVGGVVAASRELDGIEVNQLVHSGRAAMKRALKRKVWFRCGCWCRASGDDEASGESAYTEANQSDPAYSQPTYIPSFCA